MLSFRGSAITLNLAEPCVWDLRGEQDSLLQAVVTYIQEKEIWIVHYDATKLVLIYTKWESDLIYEGKYDGFCSICRIISIIFAISLAINISVNCPVVATLRWRVLTWPHLTDTWTDKISRGILGFSVLCRLLLDFGYIPDKSRQCFLRLADK